MFRSVFVTFFLVSLSGKAFAQIEVNAELGYTQETSSYSQSAVLQKTVTGLGLYMPIKSGSFFAVGFEYQQASGIGISNTGTEVDSVTTSPMFGMQFQFGPKKLYRFFLNYSPIAKSEVTMGAVNQSWSGSAMLVRFAIAPNITDSFSMVVGINYYSASFTERSGTSNSIASYEQINISPSLGLNYSFK